MRTKYQRTLRLGFLIVLSLLPVALGQAIPIFYTCFPGCGLDTNDGLTPATAKQTIKNALQACEALVPGGGGSNNACHIHVISPPWFPGSGPHVMGMWDSSPSSFQMLGPFDKNYAHPPAGWFRQLALVIDCEDGTPANFPSGPECVWMNGPSGTTRTPMLQLSGTNVPIRVQGFFFGGCVPLEESVDSSGNAFANAQTNNVMFTDSTFQVNQAPGCGPGVLLGQSGFGDEFRDSVIGGNLKEVYAISTATRDASGSVMYTIGQHDIPARNEFGGASIVFVSGVADQTFDMICRVAQTTPTSVTCKGVGAAATSTGGHLFSERSRSLLQYSSHGFTLDNVLLSGVGLGAITGPYCQSFTVIAHDSPTSESLSDDDAQFWANGKGQLVWQECGGIIVIGNAMMADNGKKTTTLRWVQ